MGIIRGEIKIPVLRPATKVLTKCQGDSNPYWSDGEGNLYKLQKVKTKTWDELFEESYEEVE